MKSSTSRSAMYSKRLNLYKVHLFVLAKVFLENLVLSLVALVKFVTPEETWFKDISGDIVLVTGGGSGIGRLMCLKFAKLGATIITWDINSKGNEETAQMIEKEGGKVYTYTVDMCNREEIYSTAAQVQKEVGDVTILVNNAGIVSGTSLLKTPDAKVLKTFEVNSLAHFWTIKAFLPTMIQKKRGHIVNIASLAGHGGINKMVDYCSSKFAAVGLDEGLKVEIFCEGHAEYIKTTCVCPYFINTGMFAGVQSKIIPILEPSYVADKAVSGVLGNKEVVLIPGWTFALLALKALLPSEGYMKLCQAFGLNMAMEQFTGRIKSD